MIDKKLYDAINENNKKEYAKYVKLERRRNKIGTVLIIIGTLAVLSLVLMLGSVIHHETQNAVKNCLKLGHSQNYCLRSL